MPAGLPDDVHRFVIEFIDSVEQLEILLLLHEQRDTCWTPGDVARALYSHPESAARRLASLHRKGILEATNQADDAEPAYRYKPQSDGTAAAVDALASSYKERRVAVITLIASRPMENVRAFSDAFRIRKRRD